MDQKFSNEDFQLYLKGIGLNNAIPLSVSVETLYLLSNKQFIYLYYKNIELHNKQTQLVSLKPRDLVQRLCVEKQGGLCYEHELLLYYGLLHIGFNVRIVSCQIREAGTGYLPQSPFSHAFLMVNISGQEYFVDPGCGVRSTRFPFPINFNDLSQIHEIFPLEVYKITENETHYQFQQFQDEKWLILYDFQKPLKFVTVDDIDKDYQDMFTNPHFIGGRDNRFMICKNTEVGKTYFIWFRMEKEFTAIKRKTNFDKIEKSSIKSYKELEDEVKKEIELQIYDYELVK